MPARHVHRLRHHKSTTHPVLLSLIYFVSIVEPLATLPQVYTIWIQRETYGVSLLSWLGFLCAAGVWLMYGVAKKDTAIIISSIAWVITEGLVVLGLLVVG